LLPPNTGNAEDDSGELEEYRLAAQDKLRINVLQWMPGAGNYQQWRALNNEYQVGASGAISVPLLGMIPAANLTTSELATSIAQRLKLRAGLGIDPDVSVEVLHYRPVYVVGQVQTPGEFAFRPGLTTTKTLAIAGGVFRDGAYRSRERERISAQGAFEDAQLELRRALMRRARLHAELDELDREQPGGGDFPLPSELRAGPATDRLIRDEQLIKQARMTQLGSQLTATRELMDLLRNEDVALGNKIAWQRQNRDLARDESQKINKLRAQDLVVNSRWLSTQLALAEHETRLLDLETAQLRVKQELSKAERTVIDVKSLLRTDITNELQRLESNIDLFRSRADTAVALMAEANAPSANAMPDHVKVDANNPDAPKPPVVTYTILRQSGDRPAKSIIADASTKVLPGDIVNVAVVPADQVPVEQMNLSAKEPDEDSTEEPATLGQAVAPDSVPPPRGALGSLTGDASLGPVGEARLMRD